MLQATYVQSSNLNRFYKSTGVFNRDLLSLMSEIVFITTLDEFKLCVPPNFNFRLFVLWEMSFARFSSSFRGMRARYK